MENDDQNFVVVGKLVRRTSPGCNPLARENGSNRGGETNYYSNFHLSSFWNWMPLRDASSSATVHHAIVTPCTSHLFLCLVKKKRRYTNFWAGVVCSLCCGLMVWGLVIYRMRLSKIPLLCYEITIVATVSLVGFFDFFDDLDLDRVLVLIKYNLLDLLHLISTLLYFIWDLNIP